MSICLCMLVKDEAAVLPRALASVRGLVNRYSIVVDVETRDETVEVIRRETAPWCDGAIHMRPFPRGGFGEARTEALALARLEGCSHVLMLDADDVIVWSGDRATLGDCSYELDVHDNGVTYARTCLFASSHGWRYEGVRHEVPVGGGPVRRLPALRYVRMGGPGAERGSDKYARDAVALRAWLDEHPDDARVVFYVAQSYKCAGDPDQALTWYDQRAAMGGWDEEAFAARLESAKLRAQLGHPLAMVIAAFLAAWEFRPSRAEPLVYLARHLEAADHPSIAEVFRSRAARIPRPADRLFVDESCYQAPTDRLALTAESGRC